MKVKINSNNIYKDTKLFVLGAYIDEDGCYREVLFKELEPDFFPEGVIKKISWKHDITMHIVPKYSIIVFARSMEDIDEYIKINGKQYIKTMFDLYYGYNLPEDYGLWAYYNLYE